MRDWNLIAAWVGILLGVLDGAAMGLFFHSPQWLGGYASWRRRLLRLGHISYFGIAFLNLAFALTLHVMHWRAPWPAMGIALAASNFLMPAICYLAAWKDQFRRLFFIPVSCVLLGVSGILFARVMP
jgi:hypothetical protein